MASSSSNMWKSNLLYFLLIVLVYLNASCTNNGTNSINEKRTSHIGLLSGSPIFDTTFDGFKMEMINLGYVENENVTYILRESGADKERMREIVEEFVVHEVDLIVTTTNDGLIVAKEIVGDLNIPIVFTFVIAPEQIVDWPSDNITGVRNPLDSFIGKRLELLLLLSPTANRSLVPYNPQYPTVGAVLSQLKEEATRLNISLVEFPISYPEDVINYVENIQDINFDAIIIFPDLTVQQPHAWATILDFANENKLPILANTPGQVEEGALFSYLVDNIATGRQAAHVASKLLEGASVSETPIEAAQVSLIFNQNAARFLGLDIPESAIREVDIVIGE